LVEVAQSNIAGQEWHEVVDFIRVGAFQPIAVLCIDGEVVSDSRNESGELVTGGVAHGYLIGVNPAGDSAVKVIICHLGVRAGVPSQHDVGGQSLL
jgi:hypothetical protein